MSTIADRRAARLASAFNDVAWHRPCIGRASLANVREDDERDLLAALIDYHAPVERTHVVIDPMDVIG